VQEVASVVVLPACRLAGSSGHKDSWGFGLKVPHDLWRLHRGCGLFPKWKKPVRWKNCAWV